MCKHRHHRPHILNFGAPSFLPQKPNRLSLNPHSCSFGLSSANVNDVQRQRWPLNPGGLHKPPPPRLDHSRCVHHKQAAHHTMAHRFPIPSSEKYIALSTTSVGCGPGGGTPMIACVQLFNLSFYVYDDHLRCSLDLPFCIADGLP